jgi:uncharacterized membrane protein YhaH (DUF805 family)
MNLLWITVATLLVLVAAITLVDLFRSRRHHGAGLFGWVVIIVLFPLIGSIFYWARRESSQAEVEEQRLADEDLRRQAARRPIGP